MTEIYLLGMISPIKVMMSSRGSRVAFLCTSFRDRTRKAPRPASRRRAEDRSRRVVVVSMATCQWSPAGASFTSADPREPVSHDANYQPPTLKVTHPDLVNVLLLKYKPNEYILISKSIKL